MKEIRAIIRLHKVNAVRKALRDFPGPLSTVEVKLFGHQTGFTELYRGAECQVDYNPKAEITFWASDADAPNVVDAIKKVARTDRKGDGFVRTLPVDVEPIGEGENAEPMPRDEAA